MKIISNIELGSLPPCTATIGFFDGVHLGHQYLIKDVKKNAERNNRKSLIVTFVEHPLKTVNPNFKPQLLSTFSERMEMLEGCGVDFCFPLDFTKELAKLTAEDFMKEYLLKKLNVKTLIVGYDHHFGSNSLSFENCKKIGDEIGMEVFQAQKYVKDDNENISSSTLRSYISEGGVDKFLQATGRNYVLEGVVVKGRQLGRKIGFPTANLEVENSDKIVPLGGVYIVGVKVDGRKFKGMANIGCRPTVEENGKLSFEIHIMDFDRDIYGAKISVSFYKRLRSEKCFNSLDELQQALQNDLENVKMYFANHIDF